MDGLPVTATVLWGANNIYSVRTDSGSIHEHIRLKGKTLPGSEGEHNPLAPGDRVLLDMEGGEPRIAAREERRNTVLRWNRTRHRMQAIAANTDRVCVVASNTTPDYRAAFVDRVLVMAELEEIPAIVAVNKGDLPIDQRGAVHLTTLEAIGYRVYRTSATTPGDEGVRSLAAAVSGTVTVFFGQSGVGKSTIINHLVPGLNLGTGEVSQRYRRGRHTTTLARQVIVGGPAGETIYIDTPGVREYDLFGYTIQEIAAGFREFREYIPDCRMPGCTHIHEPGCAVRDAVQRELIGPVRYESYRRIADSAGERP
jgi:ribosome biogenesis GTPase